VGVRSTALLFGRHTAPILNGFSAVTVVGPRLWVLRTLSKSLLNFKDRIRNLF
jgi:hypothetical protein